MAPGRHRLYPPVPAGRLLRSLAAALLAVLLFPCVVVLCAGVCWRATAANPAYVMGVLRDANLLAAVKTEFLDGLAESSGLGQRDRLALRQALEEGIPVSWLDTQVDRLWTGLTAYLSSDEEKLTIELPVVEIKVSLLEAVRDHMGETFYLQAARGFQDFPDYVDIGGLLDTAALRRLRPVWRGVTLAPIAAGAAALVLSALLWLVAGRGARGMAVTGGVWTAGGLVVVVGALVLGTYGGRVLASVVPFALPELGSVSLLDLVLTGFAGVRSHLMATGSGAVIAGAFALSLPRVERERAERERRRAGGGKEG